MSFPMMSTAFWGWTEPVQFNVVAKKIVDGQAIEIPQNMIFFEAVMEPLPIRLLMMKGEGERRFKYWTLWTEQELMPDSILQDQCGTYYRVTSKQDWRSGDYQEYEIVQTPTPPYAGQ